MWILTNLFISPPYPDILLSVFTISPSLPAGLQNSAEDVTLKWYKDLQEAASRCAQSFEQLSSAKDGQVGLFTLKDFEMTEEGL